jgi:hypothetical protein
LAADVDLLIDSMAEALLVALAPTLPQLIAGVT